MSKRKRMSLFETFGVSGSEKVWEIGYDYGVSLIVSAKSEEEALQKLLTYLQEDEDETAQQDVKRLIDRESIKPEALGTIQEFMKKLEKGIVSRQGVIH